MQYQYSEDFIQRHPDGTTKGLGSLLYKELPDKSRPLGSEGAKPFRFVQNFAMYRGSYIDEVKASPERPVEGVSYMYKIEGRLWFSHRHDPLCYLFDDLAPRHQEQVRKLWAYDPDFDPRAHKYSLSGDRVNSRYPLDF